MRVALIGAHGHVAQLLIPILNADGHQVTGFVRNPEQFDRLRALGAAPCLGDIEKSTQDDWTELLSGHDAIIFSAGAGGKGGPTRTQAVDRAGAMKIIDAASQANIRRFIMVSAHQAYPDFDASPNDNQQRKAFERIRPYFEAKAAADEYLKSSNLDWTIIAPGLLTNDEPTGRIVAAATLPNGSIPRADVAATIATSLNDPRTAGRFLAIDSGDTIIAEALANATAQRQ